MSWTPEEEARFVERRKRRNMVIALVLGAFALLFYGITISRMAG